MRYGQCFGNQTACRGGESRAGAHVDALWRDWNELILAYAA